MVSTSVKEVLTKIKQAREGLVSMMEEKADKTLEKNGGIKSIEIISEEIAEDGNSAVVKFKTSLRGRH